MPNFVILTKIEGLLRVKISVAAERVNWVGEGFVCDGSGTIPNHIACRTLNVGGERLSVEESKDEVLALLSRATQWVPRAVPLAVVGEPPNAPHPADGSHIRSWVTGIREVADEACTRFARGDGAGAVPYFRDIEQRASKALKGEK